MIRPRIYVDTNAHIPYYISDLFGFLAARSVIDLLWSEFLIAEILEVTERLYPNRPNVSARESQWAALRAAFPDGEVTEAEWRVRLVDASGPDVDDHAHQAAALAGSASILVTSDRKGFPASHLAQFGVRVLTPDGFSSSCSRRTPARRGDPLVPVPTVPETADHDRRLPSNTESDRTTIRRRTRRALRQESAARPPAVAHSLRTCATSCTATRGR